MIGNNHEIQSDISSAIEQASRALTKIVAGEVRPDFNSWVGAGNNEVYASIVERLGIQVGESLKTLEGESNKSEWLATSNPNVIVLQEYYREGSGEWEMKERSVGVVNNGWVEIELSSNG